MAINLENVLSSIGTIEELNNIQNYFNTVCENCRAKLIVEAKAKELSSSPLLYLMEAFSSLSPELFATKQGRTIIRQYIDECRKNDAVKAVYTVYETIKEADKNTADYTLLNEIKSLVGNIDTESLKEGTKVIGSIFENAYKCVGAESENLIPQNNISQLNEAMNYFLTTNKQVRNVPAYYKSLNVIKEFIENNTPVIRNNGHKETNVNECIRSFNNKFNSDSLTDEEMALVKEVYESENKELVFEKYKNQCLDNINEAINRTEEQESCDRLYEFKERVNAKEYKYETLGEDVANFIELGKLVLA